MKKELLFLSFITISSEVIVISSCQKEVSCWNCQVTNQPPVAKAGRDQSIILPSNSVTLDGSGSMDPDGSISSYAWNQIRGPNQSTLSNSSQVSPLATNLILGIYQFELKVTDNGGLSAKDTVQITVIAANSPCSVNRPVLNAQLVPVGVLSQARMNMLTATAGTKILFAGGLLPGYFISTRVDIYDIAANAWSTAELSQLRHGMAVATVGNKIFFAGGGYDDLLYGWMKFTRVDIYDAVANTWAIAELSEARGDLTAATLGDKVFFAGGYYWNNGDFFSNRVDIYDNATNTWSTTSLSESRAGLCATTAGNKIYFAGGWTGRDNANNTNISSKIDIYDGTTNSWSTSSLNEGKYGFFGTADANKIYWAGGLTRSSTGITIESSQVEIRDINTQASTITCLSQAKPVFGTVVKGNEIVFFMGQNFDIYNTASDKWSIGTLNEDLFYPCIISLNNKIYVAGGALAPNGDHPSNQVSLLEW